MSEVQVFVTAERLSEKYQGMSEQEMVERVRALKEELKDELVILSHHYQRDEVYQFADFTGDSLKLARQAAEQKDKKFIVFCGVHFMAETADILTGDEQIVVLPDMKAGCSMADMATLEQVEEAWEYFVDSLGDTFTPITYVNSTAAIKSFCGQHHGMTCTSSNAEKVFRHAYQQKERILFLPDEHLGRNTAVKLGIPEHHMAVWNPETGELEGVKGSLEDIRIILWKGYCSVHLKFTPEHVKRVRENDPEMKVIVHPECRHDVVKLADDNGSTEYIIKQIEQAPPGSRWAIGTEVNLVQRLAKQHPDKKIVLLNDMICPCLTMNRIDLPHLLWSLESYCEGQVINRIQVSDEIAEQAVLALDRMLKIG